MWSQELDSMIRHRQRKQGHVVWEEYRDVVRMCRGRIRKVKAWMKLSLARDAKNNRKGFFIDTLFRKERPGRMYPLCWMRRVNW